MRPLEQQIIEDIAYDVYEPLDAVIARALHQGWERGGEGSDE